MDKQIEHDISVIISHSKFLSIHTILKLKKVEYIINYDFTIKNHKFYIITYSGNKTNTNKMDKIIEDNNIFVKSYDFKHVIKQQQQNESSKSANEFLVNKYTPHYFIFKSTDIYKLNYF